MKMRNLGFLLAVWAMATVLGGCGGISEPERTGFPAAEGIAHGINISVSNKAVPFGGNATIQVAIRDAEGNPVPAELLTGKVFFTSILGGTFADTAYSNGLVVIRYTAPGVSTGKGVGTSIRGANLPSDLPIDDEISVSFNGAIAKVAVMLYRLS